MPVGADLIGRLLDRHANALVLYARQLCSTPDDVVQQAFMKLATLSEPPENPIAWLFQVVRNESLMANRSMQRRRTREREFARSQQSWFQSSSDDAIDGRHATSTLEALAIDQREIVTAHIWGGLTFREIGRMMELSDSTAHRKYHEALTFLRKQIGATCQKKD